MVEAGLGLQPVRVAIADGQYTSTIYGWIKESKFDDVLTSLEVGDCTIAWLVRSKLAFSDDLLCSLYCVWFVFLF